jgi:putative membrane protein
MGLAPLPHGGAPLTPHDLWAAWNLEPPLLFLLALTVLLYALGTRNVWRRAGRGHGISVRTAAHFAGATLALLLALVSPLDAIAGVLFSAHMVQHLVLVLLAAPLLVRSHFPLALLWALPRRAAQSLGRATNHQPFVRAWRLLASPLTAWLLFAVAVWAWHLPAFYEAALLNETVHAIEHLVLLATAMLFWWVPLEDIRPAYVRYGLAVLYLFTTTLHSTVLGALMTFTSSPWYPYYAPLVGAWGLTPLQDQQLAGLIMWMPGGFVFTALTIAYFAAWLRALETRNASSSAPAALPVPSEKSESNS